MGRIEGIVERKRSPFLLGGEDGMLVISPQEKFKWIIIILRCLEETKISNTGAAEMKKNITIFECDYYNLFKLPAAYDIIS